MGKKDDEIKKLRAEMRELAVALMEALEPPGTGPDAAVATFGHGAGTGTADDEIGRLRAENEALRRFSSAHSRMLVEVLKVVGPELIGGEDGESFREWCSRRLREHEH